MTALGSGQAVRHAAVLEHLARLASETLRVRPALRPMQRALLDKHFLRKHGRDAYYGQVEPSRPRARSNKQD